MKNPYEKEVAVHVERISRFQGKVRIKGDYERLSRYAALLAKAARKAAKAEN